LDRCNNVALFYIVEYTKWKLDIYELSDFYGATTDLIANSYFEHRGNLKKYYLKNMNCMNFTHFEPLPEVKRPAELDELF